MKTLILLFVMVFTVNKLQAQKLILIETNYATPYGESNEGRDSLFVNPKSFTSKEGKIEFICQENTWLSSFGSSSVKKICALNLEKREAWVIGQDNFDQATTNKIIAIYQSTLKKKKK